MQSRYIAMVIVAMTMGPVLSLLITPIFSIIRKIFYVPFIRKRLVDKAIKDGHVVRAQLIRSGDITVEHGDMGFTDSGKMVGTYRYEYQGKQYTHRIMGTMRMPDEITLYFQKKPRKATTASQLGLRESRWGLHFAMISAISSLCIFVAEVAYYA